MRVIVIGGGLVGLFCAYELRRAGADVSVIERDRCGEAASKGNAGWIVPALSTPLPSPGITKQALQMLLKKDGSLRMRPRFDMDFFRWCWRFWRSSSDARYRRGVEATLTLNQKTIQLYDDLRESGVEFEMDTSGLLLVALTQEKLEDKVRLIETVRNAGYEGKVDYLDAVAVQRLEPALSEDIAGGLHARDTRHVRPESVTAGLLEYLTANGVEIIEDSEVFGILSANNGGWKVRTSSEDYSADKLVVAAGVWSADLMRDLGIKLPLEAGKGYSLTAGGRGTRPTHPMNFAEVNVACTPFRDQVRVSGVFELGGKDLSVDHSALEMVVQSASAYLKDWEVENTQFQWAGLRPATPDDLPIIGSVPDFDGLYLATGHGTLGVTLAPATAAALAPLVLEGELASEIKYLGLDRF